MRTPRLLASVLAALLVALLGVASVAAQGGILGDKLRTGGDVTVPTGETVASDLYAFGGTVRVDGTVEGDLVATGGQITITGTIAGDVVAAGGTLDVGGEVEGDVRLAGGTLTVSGTVGEDALAAGGQVRVASGATVGEDLIASAGQLSIDGTVEGSVLGTAGAYSRAGTVGGSEDVNITDVGPTAPTTTDRVVDAIRYIVVVVLFGLLALWLAPRLFRAAEAAITQRPLPVVGWGVVALLGFLVAIVVVTIVVIVIAVVLGLLGFGALVGLDVLGWIVAIGGLILAYAILAGFLADAVVGFALARLVTGRARRLDAPPDRGADVGLLVIGAIVVAVLASLPIVGGWIKLIVAILGLGAFIAAWWYGRRRRLESAPPLEEARVT